jgi:hypothetical protein
LPSLALNLVSFYKQFRKASNTEFDGPPDTTGFQALLDLMNADNNNSTTTASNEAESQATSQRFDQDYYVPLSNAEFTGNSFRPCSTRRRRNRNPEQASRANTDLFSQHFPGPALPTLQQQATTERFQSQQQQQQELQYNQNFPPMMTHLQQQLPTPPPLRNTASPTLCPTFPRHPTAADTAAATAALVRFAERQEDTSINTDPDERMFRDYFEDEVSHPFDNLFLDSGLQDEQGVGREGLNNIATLLTDEIDSVAEEDEEEVVADAASHAGNVTGNKARLAQVKRDMYPYKSLKDWAGSPATVEGVMQVSATEVTLVGCLCSFQLIIFLFSSTDLSSMGNLLWHNRTRTVCCWPRSQSD